MPYYYFDSTALVKRYSMERGTRIVNKLMVKRGKVAILPTWTVTELYSAFSNRAQQGELTRDDCYSVIHKFERESAQGLFQFVARAIAAHVYGEAELPGAANRPAGCPREALRARPANATH